MKKQIVEFFSAGCPVCVEAAERVRHVASAHEFSIHDMLSERSGAARSRTSSACMRRMRQALGALRPCDEGKVPQCPIIEALEVER